MPAIRICALTVAALTVGATGRAMADARLASPTGTRQPAYSTANSAASARMPTRAGTIVLKVTDYDAARRKLHDAAVRQGAELLNSRTEVDYRGKQHGWVRLRLASDQLPQLLASIQTLGKLYAEALQTGERSSEYEELERRVARLREHQQRLASLLESPRRMRGSDILYLQERLFRAGVDEGMLEQRRVDLKRGAQVSTLVVELFEAEPHRVMDLGNWYAGAVLRARTQLYRLLARALTAGAFLLVLAPVWIPALLVALLLGRWLWRQSRAIAMRLAALMGFLTRVLSALRGS